MQTENTLTPMKDIIASRLKSSMATQDLSAIELARRAKVKPSFIYDILNGKSANPSTVRLARVANTLNVSLAWLAGQDSNLASPSVGDTPYITVPMLSLQNGKIVTSTIEGDPYYFRRAWINDRLGTAPDNIRMLFVTGDSMEPTLCHGDMVLVDITKKSPSPPGNFVLFDGVGLIIKRLELISGGDNGSMVRITSDNPQYESAQKAMEDINIVGRVVWFAREM